jgi:hypothetical protein
MSSSAAVSQGFSPKTKVERGKKEAKVLIIAKPTEPEIIPSTKPEKRQIQNIAYPVDVWVKKLKFSELVSACYRMFGEHTSDKFAFGKVFYDNTPTLQTLLGQMNKLYGKYNTVDLDTHFWNKQFDVFFITGNQNVMRGYKRTPGRVEFVTLIRLLCAQLRTIQSKNLISNIETPFDNKNELQAIINKICAEVLGEVIIGEDKVCKEPLIDEFYVAIHASIAANNLAQDEKKRQVELVAKQMKPIKTMSLEKGMVINQINTVLEEVKPTVENNKNPEENNTYYQNATRRVWRTEENINQNKVWAQTNQFNTTNQPVPAKKNNKPNNNQNNSNQNNNLNNNQNNNQNYQNNQNNNQNYQNNQNNNQNNQNNNPNNNPNKINKQNSKPNPASSDQLNPNSKPYQANPKKNLSPWLNTDSKIN